MANFEVLSLDPTTPQIRAPGAGDGYSVPRDMTFSAGTTLTVPTANITTLDATNVEVTNVKAKDGTAAVTIADSTGIVSLSANPVLSGGAANCVLYLNGSKAVSSTADLVFDGTNLIATRELKAASSGIPVSSFVNGLNVGGYDSIGFAASPGNALAVGGYRAAQWSAVELYTSGTLKAVLDSSGNLGLGVTPSAWASGWKVLEAQGGFLGGGATSYLELGQNVFYDGAFKYKTTGAASLYEQNAGSHRFFLAASGTAGNAITFTQAATLDANGTWLLGTTTAPAGATSANKYSVVKGSTEGVLVFGKANTGGGAITGNAGAGILFYTYTGTDGSETYSERMRLDASGNLGLGVTPSAWDSGYKALQIGQAASFWGATGSNFTTITNNAIFDGAYKYKNNGIATQYVMGTGGTHAWSYAASGTAGNAITFTQAMTLDASGNLSLGPASTAGTFNIAKGAGVNAYMEIAGNNNTPGVTSMLFGQNSSNFGYCWNRANEALLFGTNGTERARITAGGYFKASNNGGYFSSAAAYHELRQTANDICVLASATDASYSSIIFYADTTRAANAGFSFASWRANGVAQFGVTGDGVIYAQNTTVQSISDGRLKENVVDATDGLNVINALRPVRYDWKAGHGNDRKNQLGFIAQEMEAVFPEAVSEWKVNEDEKAYKTVGPGALIPVLVKAMQEQQAMIEELKAKVAQLEAR